MANLKKQTMENQILKKVEVRNKTQNHHRVNQSFTAIFCNNKNIKFDIELQLKDREE